MSWVFLLVMWLILIPSVLMIVVPLVNKLLNTQFLWFFDVIMDELDIYIGAMQDNYILIILWLIFFLMFLRFCFRTISVLSSK